MIIVPLQRKVTILYCFCAIGQLPYKGVKGVVELYSKLKDGIRLAKPPHCSNDL